MASRSCWNLSFVEGIFLFKRGFSEEESENQRKSYRFIIGKGGDVFGWELKRNALGEPDTLCC